MSEPLLSPAEALQRLHEMIRIRRFEARAAELYTAGRIRGFLHLYDGEEAVAVGVMAVLRPEDAIVATYREHGQALARGVSMNALMAELYGKQEGCCRGHGGSMHIFDAASRFYGGNAIVAGGLPLAVGLALAEQQLGRDGIVACFFGDGAMAEGEFHEALNLAVLWRLPVLFLCENNLYAMGTALDRTHGVTDLRSRAAAYGLPATSVDGMRVGAVEHACGRAAALARAGEGPSFIEFQTYRFRAHSMFDAQLYRDPAEVAEWRQRDPITLLTTRLRESGALSDEALARLERQVEAEVDAAVAFAEAGTWRPAGELADDVYTR
jgi:pyruvate dehydrogenase E1 component alpha subunit